MLPPGTRVLEMRLSIALSALTGDKLEFETFSFGRTDVNDAFASGSLGRLHQFVPNACSSLEENDGCSEELPASRN